MSSSSFQLPREPMIYLGKSESFINHQLLSKRSNRRTQVSYVICRIRLKCYNFTSWLAMPFYSLHLQFSKDFCTLCTSGLYFQRPHSNCENWPHILSSYTGLLHLKNSSKYVIKVFTFYLSSSLFHIWNNMKRHLQRSTSSSRPSQPENVDQDHI